MKKLIFVSALLLALAGCVGMPMGGGYGNYGYGGIDDGMDGGFGFGGGMDGGGYGGFGDGGFGGMGDDD